MAKSTCRRASHLALRQGCFTFMALMPRRRRRSLRRRPPCIYVRFCPLTGLSSEPHTAMLPAFLSFRFAMIGIIIVTHGNLAAELLAAVQHIVGPQSHIKTVCIGPQDDIDQRRAEISAAIKAVDLGKGVVLVTDMFGGTPCNLALGHLKKDKVEVLAGANLPSLIKLIGLRTDAPLDKAVDEAIKSGRKYMRAGSSELAARPTAKS